MRPGARRALGDSEEDMETKGAERLKSKIRAHVEHPFRVIKQQFGYRCRLPYLYPGRAQDTLLVYVVGFESFYSLVDGVYLEEEFADAVFDQG